MGEREDNEDDGQSTYQWYELTTRPDGSIAGSTETNDNEDRGHPTSFARWDVKYSDFEHMKRATGLSHIGCIGCKVTVRLDGKRI